MTGSSRNVRLADWMFDYLQENGESTVQDIKDYINHRRKKDRTNYHTFSSHQIGQVLRTSPLFEKTGLATNTYFDGQKRNRGQVTVWRARTPEEIVEKVGTKVTQHYIRKSQPKAVTNALEIMGVTQ